MHEVLAFDRWNIYLPGYFWFIWWDAEMCGQGMQCLVKAKKKRWDYMIAVSTDNFSIWIPFILKCHYS